METAAQGLPLVDWLGEATGAVLRLGGKAASIDRLARFGLRVPPAFCVTTDAFRAHLTHGSVGEQVRDAIHALPDDGARLRLVAVVLGEPFGATLRRELDGAVERLRAERADDGILDAKLAVRSSAVGEDGAMSSYAGMHDTELGVPEHEVEAAIRRCWASLWSERALGYRRLRNLPLDGEAMAVVVQALVPADAAAVVFTRHPITGRSDQVLINAVRGLGEAMVSGEVTPDSYLFDKADRGLRERRPASGDLGGDALDDDQLHELVELTLEIEERFGSPVDVEAALAGGRWYVLQARPVTA